MLTLPLDPQSAWSQVNTHTYITTRLHPTRVFQIRYLKWTVSFCWVNSSVGSFPEGLALAAPFEAIYFGLWGYNCVLACIAIGGMFYALTWQVHLLAITCGEFTLQWQLGTSCLSVTWPVKGLKGLDGWCCSNMTEFDCGFSSPAFFCAYLGSAIANVMSTVSTMLWEYDSHAVIYTVA